MCGRFALHANPDVVALQFGLDAAPAAKPRYNVCPGTDVLVVRADRAGRRTSGAYRWGLVPHWAKDPSIGPKLANARGETLDERPAFRDSFREWRCLVPASGYYEWKSAGRAKQPWYLRPVAAELFGLAGISALWQGPRGPLRSVSLITTAANSLTGKIHDRMPLIVAPEDYATWLDPQLTDSETLKRLVRPYPAERMQAHAVSRRVNRPEPDDPGLIEPAHDAPAQGDLL